MKTRLVVVAFIENNKGEVLLGMKKTGNGVYHDTWHNPGGKVEDGETLEEALRREVMEETGLKIESFERLTFNDDITDRFENGIPQKIHLVFLPYIVKAKNINATSGSDFEKLKWFNKSELSNINLNPQAKKKFIEIGWMKV